MNIPEKLAAARRDHLLLAAHRGVSGGNIPCNTLTAYQIALNQGADIVEIDVARSQDGQLFTFHPHMERAQLFSPVLIANMPGADVAALRYVNIDDVQTQFGVQTLDQTFDLLAGRCFVNVDKFWIDVPGITECIRRHGMEQDVLIKTPPREDYFDLVEKYAPDLPYMVVLHDEDKVTDELFRRKLNFVGVELDFATEDCELCQDDYIRAMHDRGMLVWSNAIIYNHRKQLAAGHSDDLAMTGKMDESWGWIIDKGFDVIQTDWLLPLRQYLQSRNMKVRELPGR